MTDTEARDRALDAAMAGAVAFGVAAAFTAADVRAWEPDASRTLGRFVVAGRAATAFALGAATDAQVRRVLEALILWGRETLESAAERAEEDDDAVPAWFAALARFVVVGNVAAAVAARGGQGLDDADRLVVAGVLAEQAGFLARYRAQVQNGTDRPAPARSSLYADAAWSTAMYVLLGRKVREGTREARRVLGPADHCSDCMYLAGLGWVPAPTVVPIGSTKCRMRCHCHIQYR